MSDLPVVDTRFNLPYRVHTNFELGMMLRGEKPLAMFYDWDGAIHLAVKRYLRMFDRHVMAGKFVRRDHVISRENNQTGPGGWMVLFALPGEEWRIDAMIDLKNSGGVWRIDQERREGELLGYQDWQNELWIARNPHGLSGTDVLSADPTVAVTTFRA